MDFSSRILDSSPDFYYLFYRTFHNTFGQDLYLKMKNNVWWMTIIALVSASSAVSAWNYDQADQAALVCEPDLHHICGPEKFPTETVDLFAARMCLRANSDAIGSSCMNYLMVENPSIVEPCFENINKFCNGVPAGDSRIHQCLTNVRLPDQLSEKCYVIMREEMAEIQNNPAMDDPDVGYDDYDDDGHDTGIAQRSSDLGNELRYGLIDLTLVQQMLKALSQTPGLVSLALIFDHIGNELEMVKKMTTNLLGGGDGNGGGEGEGDGGKFFESKWEVAMGDSLSSDSSSSSSSSSLSSYYAYYYATDSSTSSSSASRLRPISSVEFPERRRALRSV